MQKYLHFNKFMIEFTYDSTDSTGGEFYDNTNHKLDYDCLDFTFKAVPPIDSLKTIEVNGLDLSNTTFENGIQYTCTLTCKYNDISLQREGTKGISRVLSPLPLTFMTFLEKSTLPMVSPTNSERRMPVE